MAINSILTSVKKLLGLSEDNTSFDEDILLHINTAIGTLRQLGVDPINDEFVVETKDDTFEDYLGEEKSKLFQSVRLYLYYKTRLGFDPPTSANLLESLKESIKEIECRLTYQIDAMNKEV
jgi:hypothetical protein